MRLDPFEAINPERLRSLSDVEKADIHAVRAIMAGRATKDQQTKGMTYLIRRLCGADDPSFAPGDGALTAFNEGRRFVGVSLRTIAALPAEWVSRDVEKPPAGRRQTKRASR